MKKKLTKKEKNALATKRIEIRRGVFYSLLKSMMPHGGIELRMPYRDEKGELRYATINAVDIFNTIKW